MLRSGRCYACKKGKIKCDEGIPQCQRCLKSGKTCRYRSETELDFRNMNSLAEEKVESRVQKILRARDLAEKAIPKPFLVTRWREDAVARFFTDYVLGSDAVPNTMTFLPELYISSNAGGCLKDAVHAAAFVNQANQLGLEWIAIEANVAYGHALASLMRVLQDPVEALKDTTLATPFLLALYEAISGYLPTGTLMDHHHHRGRMSLLRLRSSHQFNSSTGRCLFGVLHEQAILKCLTRHEKPMEEAAAWTRIFTKGPPQKVAELSVHTTHLCAEAQILFDSSQRSRGWERGLLKIIEDATAIDLQYQCWIDKNSQSDMWRYQTYSLSPDDALPADGMVQVHHDLYTAYIWTSCRSKRAHLHEVLLHCLSLLGCHPAAKDLSTKLKSLELAENVLTRSKCIIEDMVSGICATVPFMLGDVDFAGKCVLEGKRMPLAGFMLLWPLHVARASTKKGSEREAWIRRRFEFIDSKLGIRYARLMANKIKREPWILT